jgi:hypothetical protein
LTYDENLVRKAKTAPAAKAKRRLVCCNENRQILLGFPNKRGPARSIGLTQNFQG